MFQTGLEFAPGTTDESKRVVGSLFTPSEIFGAYRAARRAFDTGDLVIVVSEQDPSGFEASPRREYVRRARELRGTHRLPTLMRVLEEQSAHKIVSLPPDSDAMWLIVARGMQTVPVMCVIYALQFEVPDSDDTSDTVSLMS